MAGIYLHIPFCIQACHYCDFHFSTNQDIKSELSLAIVSELNIQKDYLEGESIATIYFGGGTPSLLSLKELDCIFTSIYNNFKIDLDAEITFEANPDDLSLEKLKELKQFGINRLSIGIQSFDDHVLKFLNRVHSKTSAIDCVVQAQDVGFNNISLDLIYAIPGQDHDAWKSNIRQAIALKPQHISSYSLTIEDKTAFGRWSAQGKLKAVDDDISATQLEILIDELVLDGFEHYEVSNFGRPGFHSRHNSNYWKQKKYLGIGPSAHSYNGVSRQFNINNNNIYIKAIKQGKIAYEIEVLSKEDKVNEYLLTTLRTNWGSDLNLLRNNFKYDLLAQHGDYIESIIRKNLAQIDKGVLKLTTTGKLYADKIASDLFLTK